jgi:hypothetical protein
MEIWVNVILNGQLTNYQISNHGNCKSFWNNKVKVLKQRKLADGYIQLALYHDGKRKNYMAHRLVAEFFIKNPENKPFVNHKDGKKSNNHISNLEWCTGSENCIHAIKTGLYIVQKGALNKRSKKVAQYLNGKLIKTFDSLKEAARAGYGDGNIALGIKKGWKPYGYEWVYVN